MSWWRLLVRVADSLLTERPGFTRSQVCAAVEGRLPCAPFHGSIGSSPRSPGAEDSRHGDESRTDDVLAGTWIHQEEPKLFCLRAHIRYWQALRLKAMLTMNTDCCTPLSGALGY